MAKEPSPMIELHLPFGQHSKVPVRPGVSASDAISGILRKRDIVPGLCTVCVDADPTSSQIDLQKDLEVIVQQLEPSSDGVVHLWVHHETLELFNSIEHQFVRVQLFPGTTCDVCKRGIFFQGGRCKRCLMNFHKKCWAQVPTLCNVYEHHAYDVDKANQLREVCEKFRTEQHNSPHAAIASDILSSLLPANDTPPPSAPPMPSRQQGGGITRQQAIRHRGFHAAVANAQAASMGSGMATTPGPGVTQSQIVAESQLYPRDRSSSAPNINAVKDEAAAMAGYGSDADAPLATTFNFGAQQQYSSETPPGGRSQTPSSQLPRRGRIKKSTESAGDGDGDVAPVLSATATSSASSLVPPIPTAAKTNMHTSGSQQRILTHLQPQRFPPGTGGPSSSSASPTSTCSSPVNHQLADSNASTLALPGTSSSSHLLSGSTGSGSCSLFGGGITPPQSAPPQKSAHHTFFMEQQQRRLRSKSPADARSIHSAAITIPSIGAGTGSGISNSLLTIEGGGGIGLARVATTAAAAAATSVPRLGGAAFHGGHPHRGGDRSKRRSIEDWEIPNHKVEFKEQIGKGSFGTVWKASYYGMVAVKKLNITTPSPEILLAFKNEVTVLKSARHGNVLNFLGVIREPELAIVTQWCQGSSLYRHIHVLEPRVEFEMQRILEITKQITQGMAYLHSREVIHRDLKTNNIFLTDGTEGTVKIGDFGLATVKSRSNNLEGGLSNPNPTGSILWMAPEVIRMSSTDPYSTLSDVYSFGVCLYELLSSMLPYKEIKSRDQILWMVGSGLLRPDSSHVREDCPRALRQLMEQCTSYSLGERPEFQKIYEDLDSIRLPKLKKSSSEPNLRSAWLSSNSSTPAMDSMQSSHYHHHRHHQQHHLPRTPNHLPSKITSFFHHASPATSSPRVSFND